MADRRWTLAAIEAALAGLPRPEFRARLKTNLERMAGMATTTTSAADARPFVHTGDRPTAAAVLRVRDAARAIEFYTRAFGAREVMRFEAGGRIPHAELALGNAIVIVRDEAPQLGYPGPDQLGGSPAAMRLDVDDPDAAMERAIEAGAAVFLPVETHFYGERTGTVADPFGYHWSLTKVVEPMTVDEMHRRMMSIGAPAHARPDWIPVGYRAVTSYLVVPDAPAIIDFTKTVFGAEEKMRSIGSAGGVHAEVRIGDSMLMIGGGAPELSWRGEPMPAALHVYVPDVDAAFERAVRAGATVDHPPADMEYGERGAGVIDPGGNRWYIATARGATFTPAGLGSVNAYLHPLRAEPLIAFLVRAFGGVAGEKHATPDGVVHHATVRIADTAIEMGEAHGPYQPMPAMFYMYAPDVDAAYRRAVEAGASSLVAPADQPYGARHAGVKDPFGNQWYLARPDSR